MSLLERETALVAEREGPQPGDESLIDRYRRMAGGFEPRPVDHVLRALDVLLAGSLLVLSAPLIGLAALVVKAADRRGSVLYRGPRVGRGGEIFPMLKFRTLHPGAEERLASLYGTDLTEATARELIRFGRFMRATKIDELPQLWNVLRGDMSLVGPRPVRPVFFEEVCAQVPAYWQRLVLRPGLTGLAQLRLTREMSWSEKLAHDSEWIADRSVVLYVAVLAATAWRLLTRRWGPH